jgi:hypothetical protein
VPERIANKIILAEDAEQQNLVRRYLVMCGHSDPFRLVPLPARSSGGSGEKYVREKYAEQVQACRSSVGRRASCVLIVIIDADQAETVHRARQLASELEKAGMQARVEDEPIVILIPKRHVETWIRALLGNYVDESIDYTKAPYKAPTPNEIAEAVSALHEWTRPNAQSGPTSPPSLTTSMPEWKKIPS